MTPLSVQTIHYSITKTVLNDLCLIAKLQENKENLLDVFIDVHVVELKMFLILSCICLHRYDCLAH